MNCLNRNKKKIYYRNFVKADPITDDYGNETGEYENTYGEIQTLYAYVTPNQGYEAERMFGKDVNYDRVIICKATDINEYSQIWVDASISVDADYSVVRVSKSLNSVSIAIRKLVQ